MPDVRTDIMQYMEQLRNMTSSDIVVLAAPMTDHPARMYWKHMMGNSNDRYKYMVIKSGQGLAGAALRLGRWVMLDDTHPGFVQERRGCPLMLAEHLHTAAVFPLRADTGSAAQGLLYIGKRSPARYQAHEIAVAQEQLETLAILLAEEEKPIKK